MEGEVRNQKLEWEPVIIPAINHNSCHRERRAESRQSVLGY